MGSRAGAGGSQGATVSHQPQPQFWQEMRDMKPDPEGCLKPWSQQALVAPHTLEGWLPGQEAVLFLAGPGDSPAVANAYAGRQSPVPRLSQQTSAQLGEE